jgi:hypothetical protein
LARCYKLLECCTSVKLIHHKPLLLSYFITCDVSTLGKAYGIKCDGIECMLHHKVKGIQKEDQGCVTTF